MARQIAVTMPDPLYERLQAVKKRLNVSGLCQEAIEQAVSIEEIRLREIPDMEKLIERLRIEAKQESKKWHTQGFEDGRQGATELSLQEFKFLESLKYIDYGEQRISLSNEFYSSEIYDLIKEQYLEGDWDNGKPDEEPYIEGWVEGALSVWEEVQEQL
jgi:DNA mismatch repair ATPase MutS